MFRTLKLTKQYGNVEVEQGIYQFNVTLKLTKQYGNIKASQIIADTGSALKLTLIVWKSKEVTSFPVTTTTLKLIKQYGNKNIWMKISGVLIHL